MTYETVAQPKPGRAKHPYEQILAASAQGLAVVIPLNGFTSDGVRSSLCGWLRAHGYQPHTRVQGHALAVWVTPEVPT